jgi:hypothetical protein
MADHDKVERCYGCGALVPLSEGATHPYIGAAPGCWELYGEVLVRGYGDRGGPADNRMAVDTYAVQHPGVPSRRSIQSVAAHLISLCCVLERGSDLSRANDIIRKALERPDRFFWLEPPQDWGGMTIVDVYGARDIEEHSRLVQEWTRLVWNAWAPHHGTVRRWADQIYDNALGE